MLSSLANFNKRSLVYLPNLIRCFTIQAYLVKSDAAWPTYLPKNLASYTLVLFYKQQFNKRRFISNDFLTILFLKKMKQQTSLFSKN